MSTWLRVTYYYLVPHHYSHDKIKYVISVLRSTTPYIQTVTDPTRTAAFGGDPSGGGAQAVRHTDNSRIYRVPIADCLAIGESSYHFLCWQTLGTENVIHPKGTPWAIGGLDLSIYLSPILYTALRNRWALVLLTILDAV